MRGWHGNCFMGSSASALEAVAARHGYVIGDVEPGFDLFLVRKSLWGERAVIDLATHPQASRRHPPRPRGGGFTWRPPPQIYRPFNVGRNGGLSPEEMHALVDPDAWFAARGAPAAEAQAKAEAAAERTVHALARRGIPCFAGHLPKPQCAYLQK